jgi:hypothetical protein
VGPDGSRLEELGSRVDEGLLRGHGLGVVVCDDLGGDGGESGHGIARLANHPSAGVVILGAQEGDQELQHREARLVFHVAIENHVDDPANLLAML